MRSGLAQDSAGLSSRQQDRHSPEQMVPPPDNQLLLLVHATPPSLTSCHLSLRALEGSPCLALPGLPRARLGGRKHITLLKRDIASCYWLSGRDLEAAMGPWDPGDDKAEHVLRCAHRTTALNSGVSSAPRERLGAK